MAVEAARLQVVVGADTSEAERGLTGIGKKVEGFGSSLKSGIGLVAGFATATAGLAVAKGGFSALADSTIGLNDRLQQAKIGFTTMLGSAEQADGFLKQMGAFAAKTPFEFPELLDTSKRMLAMGFSADQVLPVLESVGNTAAAMGSGSEGVNRITTALGQMQAKTKVSAEEINQLTEAGVPAWRLLADAMGKPVDQVQKLASEGKISSDVFLKAFQDFSKQNYGDMMEKQSHTFSGAMSTIRDSLSMALAKGAQPFFEQLTKLADKLSTFVQSDAFTAWTERAAEFTGRLTGAIADLVKRAIPLLQQLGSWFLRDGLPALQRFSQFLIGVFQYGWVLARDAVLTFIQALSGDWTDDSKIRPLHRAIGLLGEAFRVVGQFVLQDAIPAIQQFVGFLQANVLPVAERVFTGIAGLVTNVAAAFQQGGLGPAVETLVSGLVNGLSTALPIILATLAQWGQALVDWVSPYIPPMLAELGNLVMQFTAWATGVALPAIGAQLAAWGQQLWAWVSPQIVPLLAELGNLLAQLGAWIVGTGLPALIGFVATWGAAFVGWLGDQIGPLLDEAGALLAALGGWIVDTALPTIIDKLGQWGSAFIAWVGPQIVPLLAELGSLLTALGSWAIETALPAIVDNLRHWGIAFYSWVNPIVADLIGELFKLYARVELWLLSEALPKIVTSLTQWGLAFSQWVIAATPGLIVELIKLSNRMNEWIATEALPEIKDQLMLWGAAFLDWVQEDVVPQLPGKLVEILNAINGWIGGAEVAIAAAAFRIGVALIQGIINGVRSMFGPLLDVLNTVKQFIQDHKGPIEVDRVLLKPAGVALMQGLNAGILDGWSTVQRTLDGITGQVGRLAVPAPALVPATVPPASARPSDYAHAVAGQTVTRERAPSDILSPAQPSQPVVIQVVVNDRVIQEQIIDLFKAEQRRISK